MLKGFYYWTIWYNKFQLSSLVNMCFLVLFLLILSCRLINAPLRTYTKHTHWRNVREQMRRGLKNSKRKSKKYQMPWNLTNFDFSTRNSFHLIYVLELEIYIDKWSSSSISTSGWDFIIPICHCGSSITLKTSWIAKTHLGYLFIYLSCLFH